MSVFHNQTFTTVDYDNDGSNTQCTDIHDGAWWYSNCGNANPNGRYMNERILNVQGVYVSTFDGQRTLKTTEIKLRGIL